VAYRARSTGYAPSVPSLISLAYPAYRAAERVACAVPARAVAPLVWLLGGLAAALMPGRRRMVARHLRRVRGRDLEGRALRQAVRTTFRSYAAYWFDTFRLCRLDRDDLDARLEAEGLEHLDQVLQDGRGAIIATPHLGSWDLGGAWLAGRGYPLVAVVERLEPPRLLEWFAAVRRRIGLEVVVRGSDVWDRLEEAVGRNQVAVLVCDRDLSGRGVPVELFGEETTLPAGPAKLARLCGTPVLPVAIYGLDGGRHRGMVRPPLTVRRTGDEEADVAELTQRLAVELEGLIRQAPEQWHLLQPNWPSDRAAA
jgi:phosphatidylinositol dimannoside acyltransferase